jgi:hypothetical protein
MTQEEYKLLIDCTAEATRRLVAKGVPREKAIEIATEMAVLAVKKKYPNYTGMGDIPVNPQPLETLAQESQAAANISVVKTIRDAVSPWLWVTSVVGFVFGIMNRRQIAKMYGDWKNKKAKRR